MIMMQKQIYDIVVIGSGPSGRELSLHSTKNGFSVALIESELVGGDCAYWACVDCSKLRFFIFNCHAFFILLMIRKMFG